MTTSLIQDRLKALVTASTFLEGRPILLEDKGNLVSQVETALQTQSLAVTIALSGGSNKSKARSRAAWDESFEVVIHRGLLDGVDVPATNDVLDDIRMRVEGAPIDAAVRLCEQFTCTRHDLREGGDGTYARVLLVSVVNTLDPHNPADPLRGFSGRFSERFQGGTGGAEPARGFSERFDERFQPQP